MIERSSNSLTLYTSSDDTHNVVQFVWLQPSLAPTPLGQVWVIVIMRFVVTKEPHILRGTPILTRLQVSNAILECDNIAEVGYIILTG